MVLAVQGPEGTDRIIDAVQLSPKLGWVSVLVLVEGLWGTGKSICLKSGNCV